MTRDTRRNEIGGAFFNKLRSTNVIATTDDDLFTLSDAFSDRIDHHEAALSWLSVSEIEDLLHSVAPRKREAAALIAAGTKATPVVAEYLTLREHDELDEETLFRALALMDVFRGGVRTSAGAPEQFAPVRAVRVPILTEINARAVVYVWMEDCPPCEDIQHTLEEMYDEIPDEIGLFSVYGPADAEILAEHYRVDGAPTVLYFLGGDIDVRLRGPTDPEVIETEIEKLVKLEP